MTEETKQELTLEQQLQEAINVIDKGLAKAQVTREEHNNTLGALKFLLPVINKGLDVLMAEAATKAQDAVVEVASTEVKE